MTRELLAQRIREALRQSGVSQRELASAIGMDATALNKALAGQRGFKSLEVARIAERLHVPTDVLLADDDANLRGAAVAARVQADQDQESVAAGRAMRLAEEISDLHALLSDLGHPAPPPIPFPEVPQGRDAVRQGELLAHSVRRQTGLDDGDLPVALERLAEWFEYQLGVDVCISPLADGLDGLALSSGHLRLALVSSSVTATRQRFTLAHELCHLVASDGQMTVDRDVFERRTSEEKRANAFAAAFLMPSTALSVATEGRHIDEGLVADLLGRFRVSLDALAFRLHNVGLVNAAGRDQIRGMASTRIALRPGRAEDLQSHNERRAPSRLLKRAMAAFAAGDLGIRPLASLLDTDPDQLLDELSPPRFTGSSEEADEQAYAL